MERFTFVSIGLAVAFVTVGARAQDARSWPDRPVHIVVPLTAGSAISPAKGIDRCGAEASLVEPDAYNLQLKKDIAGNAALVKAAGIPINGGQ